MRGGIAQGCASVDSATLEIGGRDNGPAGTGNNNFGLSGLTVAEGASVALVDLADNGNRGPLGEPEALYATSLTLAAGAVLNLNGLHLYVNGSPILPGPNGLGVVIDQSATAGVDGDLNLSDWAVLRDCLSGPDACYGDNCQSSDLDCDSDVDLRDFRVFQLLFNNGNP